MFSDNISGSLNENVEGSKYQKYLKQTIRETICVKTTKVSTSAVVSL